ncbi:MAG TPA: hypothetical protein VL221_05205 [Bacteroidota bacterium]|nr:hypothetical protein [Bacteroidota bacterium]
MKRLILVSPLVVLAVLLISCRDFGPPVEQSLIVTHVHWGSQGIPGIKVVLVGFADTAYTNASGTVVFPVVPGSYTVRAFDINRGGPFGLGGVDYGVTAPAGSVGFVDIIDCLPCV